MSSYYSNSGSFREKRPAEDVDPMSSLSNMGDIMLVFACGLMTALVLAWNVDLGQFSQVDVGASEAIDEPEAVEQVMQGGGSTYVEKGTVYQDAATGKYYLVQPDDAQGSGK